MTIDERHESKHTAMPLETGNGSENLWSSEGMDESTDVKKKKHKKVKQLCGDTGAPDGDNVLGVSFTLDPATLGEKKKEKEEKGRL